MTMKYLLCLFAALLPCMLGYRHFQDQIPNGSRVPHPCKANFVWHGLGHMDKDGGGMRNPFGVDFEKNGFIWDKCLCQTDSDNDGKTNGEELGDPDCEWVPGTAPKVTALSMISHPGICDPYDSEYCKRLNNWEFCDQEEFQCDLLKADGVMNFTIKFPKTKVPKEETTYICLLIDIPTDGDWHVIGNWPQLDNANVMHHVITSMCSQEEADLLGGQFDTPTPCDMVQNTCSGSLPGWTVGEEGYCIPEEYGMRIGKETGYTKALLEFHWNNPEHRDDYWDGSGMTYFYENRRREFDAGGAIIGPMMLDIPPYQLYYEQSSLCSAECSQILLTEPVYITAVFPHMHYMGRGFIMEHWRNGERLTDLVNTESYAYDSPLEYRFNPPIEYHPGDELIVRCFFNSMSQNKRTYWGESTQAEMCLALVTWYPDVSMGCFGVADKTFCETNMTGTNQGDDSEEICDLEKYFETQFGADYAAMIAVCDPEGLECWPDCLDALKKVYEHECMQGDYHYFIKTYSSRDEEFGVPFLHLLNSCNEYEVQTREQPSDANEFGDGLCPQLSGGLGLSASLALVMVALMTRL